MHMLLALCDFGRRIIGQPIVPGMQSGVTAADRIILIPPDVVIVRYLVQRRDRRVHALSLKGVGADARCGFRDQRLVRNIRVPLRRGLCTAVARTDNEQNENDEEKVDQLHRGNSIARRRIGKRKSRQTFMGLQSPSSSSASNCSFKWRRADFLIARRSAATACFSAWRSRRVRVSTELGKCEIFGRWAPTFRSFGFAYGSIEKLPAFICDKKERQCCKLKDH